MAIVSHSNSDTEAIQKRSFFSQFKLKESLLAFGLFGSPAFGMLLPGFLKMDQLRKRGSTIALTNLGIAALALLFLLNDPLSFWSRLLFCFSVSVFLIASDCRRGKFNDHIIAHIINQLYVFLFLYFFLMNLNPEGFADAMPQGGWTRIINSSSKAADLVLLCFVFQNLGYYIVWELIPFSGSIKKWSSSSTNLVNLDFVATQKHQLWLILILMSLGLVYRFWNIATGKVGYTDTEGGVPELINGFLAQFERLYVVGWLYGYSISLRKEGSRLVSSLVWIFTLVEFVFQLVSGSKGRFFNFVILPLVTTYLLVRQKVSWLIFSIISILGAFSWLVVYPVLAIYRNSLMARSSGGRNGGSAISLPEAFSILLDYSWDQYVTQLLTPFNKSGVAEQIAAVTAIVHYQVAQPAFLLWQRLFLFWVPRFMWADKAQPVSGNEIGKLSGRVNFVDNITSVLTTSPGEVYLYYGMAGSALLILAGLLFRWFGEATSPFKIFTSFRVAVFVAYLPLIQGSISGTFESALTGFTLQVGVLYGILWLSKRFIK